MPVVLPGKPQAKLQAISTGRWTGRRIIAYISGKALVVLTSPHHLQDTIYTTSDEDLEAVTLDEVSGKIAVCSRSTAYIYVPNDQAAHTVKWSFHLEIRDHDKPSLAGLSWGTSEELLLAGAWLCLYSTTESALAIWRRQLGNLAKLALFSPDATLIASTGQNDRLAKIWRRISFNFNEAQFDFAYLSHPATVTGIRWRGHCNQDPNGSNVLYTTCADNILRIWTALDAHSLQILQLWAQVDLQASIQPRLFSPQEPRNKRYVFIIDCDDFASAMEVALRRAQSVRDENHGLDHLQEVARRNPDVCVILDDEGRMSAWGFDDIGHRSRTTTNVFNIAHVDGAKFPFVPQVTPEEDYIQLYAFCDHSSESGLTLLAHSFDGRIAWLEAHVDTLFDASPNLRRFHTAAIWSGHASPIEKLVRSVSGEAIVSRTSASECTVWRQMYHRGQTTLGLLSKIQLQEPVLKICVLGEGNIVIILLRSSISVWDAGSLIARCIACYPYSMEGQPLCLILLPEATANTTCYHVATISSKMKGIAWEIQRHSETGRTQICGDDDSSSIISEFCQFNLDNGGDTAFVIAVDPAGSSATISGFLDSFARDVALSYNTTGDLLSWTAKVDLEARDIKWLLTSTVETGVAYPSLASGSSIRKAAIVDKHRTELTIWDTREGQLEFRHQFDGEIKDLDWTSTPDNQSVLAIGFTHHVHLLTQLRYDYLDSGPAWTTTREFGFADLTPHPLGDSVWLGHGDIAIGAGNQILVPERKIKPINIALKDFALSSHQHHPMELFDIVTRLNGQLPVFHPQFISQCILRGKLSLVQRIIVALHKQLKFFTEGDPLDSFLGLPLGDFLNGDEARNPVNAQRNRRVSRKGRRRPSYAEFVEDEWESQTVTEDLAASLNKKLTVIAIPELSSSEQFHLADIVECVATVEKHRRSMDDNASRFLLSFRQQNLRKDRRGQVRPDISWRDIVWAYHSNSQDILIDLVCRHFHGTLQWEQARETGIFMWIKDSLTLKAQLEIISRNQYTRTAEKSPIDCSLFYLALRKKNVLLGLWRMAAWNPEQRATQKLLSNDFQESRWKTAALKNAYVLLGRHRYEYAAAFFLLADCLKDAVNVCVDRLKDLQLGVAIARVYEGDDSPVLIELLEDRILPQAAAEGNRWLATWAFWMLNRRDMAVRALLSPVHTLVEKTVSPGLQAKLYLVDDPALVILYEQLREKTLQTLQGASKISSKLEWGFLIHIARLYDRMGCDLLALDLVRNWEFLRRPPQAKEFVESIRDPRRMLRRRSSLVVADLPSSKVPLEMRIGGTKSAISVFEEPDASSLLDDFGY